MGVFSERSRIVAFIRFSEAVRFVQEKKRSTTVSRRDDRLRFSNRASKRKWIVRELGVKGTILVASILSLGMPAEAVPIYGTIEFSEWPRKHHRRAGAAGFERDKNRLRAAVRPRLHRRRRCRSVHLDCADRKGAAAQGLAEQRKSRCRPAAVVQKGEGGVRRRQDRRTAGD